MLNAGEGESRPQRCCSLSRRKPLTQLLCDMSATKTRASAGNDVAPGLFMPTPKARLSLTHRLSSEFARS